MSDGIVFGTTAELYKFNDDDKVVWLATDPCFLMPAGGTALFWSQKTFEGARSGTYAEYLKWLEEMGYGI